MSEPLGVEERARLREWAETPACPWPTDRWESVEVAMSALLDEVDRLTEALEAAQSVAQRDEAEKGRLWQHLRDRAERAEADLAGLRAGVEALGKRWAASEDRGWVSSQADELLDLLLDTATEEAQGAP